MSPVRGPAPRLPELARHWIVGFRTCHPPATGGIPATAGGEFGAMMKQVNASRAALVAIALLVGWGGSRWGEWFVVNTHQGSRCASPQPSRGRATHSGDGRAHQHNDQTGHGGELRPEWLVTGRPQGPWLHLSGHQHAHRVSTLDPAGTRCQSIPGDRSDDLRTLSPTRRGHSHVVAAVYVNRPASFARREVLHDRLHHEPSAPDGGPSPHNGDSAGADGTEEVAVERPSMPELSS